MRRTKRYSNVTFTKRVDHDAGRHRTLRAPSEPRVCTRCSSVYAHRRWMLATDPHAAMLVHSGVAAHTVCPGCRRAAAGVPGGYLRVEGGFYTAHRTEVERLLGAEARRASADNPLGRIMEWDRRVPAVLTVTTTTEHLAGRLGHALHKAFGGSVHYGFSHENKLARITWRRAASRQDARTPT